MTIIQVKKGNITTAPATAIVNAGNTSLWLGSGVAGAIRSDCGEEVAQELERIAELRSPRRRVPYKVHAGPGVTLDRVHEFPCDLGEVVVTNAGKLSRRKAHPIRYVFHAAVMDCRGPHKAETSPGIIYEATKNCVLTAIQLGVRKVAFPLFGTGVGGMCVKDSALTMIEALEAYPVTDMYALLYGYTEQDYQEILQLHPGNGV
jgi:O-acetyl-ADP-ribose deacetylase (regulator of RNase III)